MGQWALDQLRRKGRTNEGAQVGMTITGLGIEERGA